MTFLSSPFCDLEEEPGLAIGWCLFPEFPSVMSFAQTKIARFCKMGVTILAELAMKVGARRETISFLEKGEYNPSLKLAVRIAQQFNVNVEELFIFEDSDF